MSDDITITVDSDDVIVTITEGDVTSNTGVSVDSEVALFSGTSGKILKRATGSGIVKAASGVFGLAVADTDYLLPSTAASLYSPVASGVTNGNSHDHNGGDGAQISHINLSGIGTNTHTQIDTHIAGVNPHSGSQPVDATLTSLALLGTAADKMLYSTGIDTWAEAAITAAGRALLDDANAAAQIATLGLDANIATLSLPASTTISAFGATLVDDADASTARGTLGLGTLATQSGTFSGTSSGTNTGDQTITLTGDVTGSGTGSFAATIANSAVSLAKMADMATASLIGRNTAGTGVPEVLSATTVRSLLGLVIGTNVQAYDADLTTWAGVTPGTGVATFLATPSSANLLAAVTDETGTGLVVFNTSPTITNPVITNISPAADFTLTQNSVVPFTSVNTGAVDSTLFLKEGKISVGTQTFAVYAPAKMQIQTTATAGLEVALMLGNPDSTNDATAVGICFATSSGLQGKGLIAYRRTGTYGVGDFIFANNTTVDNTSATLADARMIIKSTGNVGIGTTDQFGSGAKVIGIANATTNPTTNPTAATVIYAASGYLKQWGSAGDLGHFVCSLNSTGATTTPNGTVAVNIGGTTYYLLKAASA